jgi:hypothetical protein
VQPRPSKGLKWIMVVLFYMIGTFAVLEWAVPDIRAWMEGKPAVVAR